MYKNHVISTQNERMTSPFGMRVLGGVSEMHNGIDFTDAQRLELTQNVEITAIADGIVVEVINGSQVGWTVSLSHDGKILSRYQHMKTGSLKVKPGDTVKKGQVIGIMGTTGYSTGIHLHLGIKENSTSYSTGTWVNPDPYMTGEKNIVSQNGDDLVSKEYDELKQMITALSGNVDRLTANSCAKWGYMTDKDFPERLKPIVQKIYDTKDFKLPNGSLGISQDMARLLIAFDDLGLFGKKGE